MSVPLLRRPLKYVCQLTLLMKSLKVALQFITEEAHPGHSPAHQISVYTTDRIQALRIRDTHTPLSSLAVSPSLRQHILKQLCSWTANTDRADKWSRPRALHAYMRDFLALKKSNINLSKPPFFLLCLISLGVTAAPTSALTSYDLGWERTICQIYCQSFLATEANLFKHSTSWPVQLYHPHKNTKETDLWESPSNHTIC